MTRPLCWYHIQGHLSRSRSNIKVTVFKKKAVAGALVFHRLNLFTLIKLEQSIEQNKKEIRLYTKNTARAFGKSEVNSFVDMQTYWRCRLTRLGCKYVYTDHHDVTSAIKTPIPTNKLNLVQTEIILQIYEKKIKSYANIQFVFHRVENIVGKGENSGKPTFSTLLTVFSKDLFLRGVDSCYYVVKA